MPTNPERGRATRVARLYAILQAGPARRVDLAAHLGVSPRTITRDIHLLAGPPWSLPVRLAGAYYVVDAPALRHLADLAEALAPTGAPVAVAGAPLGRGPALLLVPGPEGLELQAVRAEVLARRPVPETPTPDALRRVAGELLGPPEQVA